MNKFAYRLSTKGNKKIITNDQTYPIYGIEQTQQQDRYIYIQFNSFNDMIREWQKYDKQYLTELFSDYQHQFKLNSYWYNSQDFANDMINNKTYALRIMGNFKKTIGAHISWLFYNGRQALDGSIKKYNIINSLDVYNNIAKKISLDVESFSKLIMPVTYKENNILTHKKLNQWVIYFNPQKHNIDFIEKLLQTAEQKLKKLKNKLCYGVVNVRTKLSESSNLAEYIIETDSINLKSNNSVKTDYIITFLHELCHRYFYKFLSANQKNQLNDFYLKNINNNVFTPNINDDIMFYNGAVVNVVKIRPDKKIQCKLLKSCPAYDKKGFKINSTLIYKQIFLDDIELINGKENINTSAFPTPYSTENYEEFFCEVFAHYFCDKLNNQDCKKWFESFIGL